MKVIEMKKYVKLLRSLKEPFVKDVIQNGDSTVMLQDRTSRILYIRKGDDKVLRRRLIGKKCTDNLDSNQRIDFLNNLSHCLENRIKTTRYFKTIYGGRIDQYTFYPLNGFNDVILTISSDNLNHADLDNLIKEFFFG